MSENSMKSIAELQSELRKKNTELQECSSYLKKAEYDKKIYRNKLKEKDYEASRLLEENRSLKNRVKELSFNLSEDSEARIHNLEKQLKHKTEELKKLKENYQKTENELKAKLDSEVRRLGKLVAEGDRKLASLKKEITEKKQVQEKNEYFELVEELQKENKELKAALDQPKELQELEDLRTRCSFLETENQKLKQSFEEISDEYELSDRVLAQNVHKAMLDIRHLLKVVKSSREGQEVSINYLLGMDEQIEYPKTSLKEDVEMLKQDLKEVRSVFSDYYAERCGSDICLTS